MHAMQACRGLQGSAICVCNTWLPPSRPSKTGPARRCSAPQAANQQQPQQQPPPVNNFKDLMQQYKSMVPAAPTSQQKSKPSSKSSNSSSKDSKGAPRLKPTPSAAPNKPSNKRAAAAASAASAKSKPATPADRAGSKGATSRGRDSSSSSRDAKGNFDNASKTDRRSSRDSSSSSSSSPRSVIPGGWLLPSNGKGFGTPPASATAAPVARKTPGGQNIVRIFRFGVEVAAVTKAVEACGWQARVALVESIRDADLILAAKCSSGGKHRNLAQGEKAASNAGVPFVVVGRKLSAANFRQALIPHLEPNSTEAAALAAAAKEAAAKAAANKAEADAFFRSAVAWKAPRQ